MDILTSIPLANSEIGIPNNHGDPEFSEGKLVDCPSMWIRILTLEEINKTVSQNLPDSFLWKKGYFPFAYYDTVGTNLFLKTRKTNSPIVLFYPPYAKDLSALNNDSEIILPNFNAFFKYARNTSFPT